MTCLFTLVVLVAHTHIGGGADKFLTDQNGESQSYETTYLFGIISCETDALGKVQKQLF